MHGKDKKGIVFYDHFISANNGIIMLIVYVYVVYYYHNQIGACNIDVCYFYNLSDGV